MRESWTDTRLDDSMGRSTVSLGGSTVSMIGWRECQRTMVHAAVVTAAFISGFAALAGLIATQF